MQQELPDLSLPQGPEAGRDGGDRAQSELTPDQYEPLYRNGFRSQEERETFIQHERMLHKSKIATACAKRLLAHRPADWPRPQNPQAVIDMVEAIAAAPRKFGTWITRPEVRALAFVHALHRKTAKKAEEK